MAPEGAQDHTSVGALATVCRVPVSGRLPWVRGRRAAALRRAVAADDIDRFVVAHLESWLTLQECGVKQSVPTFLDLHNVLSSWYRQRSLAGEAARWAGLEAQAAAVVDAVAVCSERERRTLAEVSPVDALVVPHGVERAEWPLEPAPGPEPVVKLFGSWDWDPNRQGLAWFLAQVWPGLSAAGLRCEIAGPGVTAEVGLLRGARVVGRVPDLAAFLADAWVVATPVRRGVGAPVKYAEALVTGVPLAATTDAADTLAVPGGLVSDDPDAWVEWVRSVVTDPEAARSAAVARRHTVLHERTWTRASQPSSTGSRPNTKPNNAVARRRLCLWRARHLLGGWEAGPGPPPHDGTRPSRCLKAPSRVHGS